MTKKDTPVDLPILQGLGLLDSSYAQEERLEHTCVAVHVMRATTTTCNSASRHAGLLYADKQQYELAMKRMSWCNAVVAFHDLIALLW